MHAACSPSHQYARQFLALYNNNKNFLQNQQFYQKTTTLCKNINHLQPSQVLTTLGSALQFEVAVGLNGAIWVDAPSPGVVVLVAHALRSTAGMSDAQSIALVQQLLDKVQKG